MAEGDRIRWNNKYLAKSKEFAALYPSQWLVGHKDRLVKHTKGMALDLATGMGRNAIFLSQLGYTVEALDISDIAINQLKDLAIRHDYSIRPTICDLDKIQLPEATYEVVIVFYYLNRNLFHQIRRSLKKGGLIIYETYTRDQIQLFNASLNPAIVLHPNELLQAFYNFRVFAYRDKVITLEDGSERAVSSIVAQKN